MYYQTLQSRFTNLLFVSNWNLEASFGDIQHTPISTVDFWKQLKKVC